MNKKLNIPYSIYYPNKNLDITGELKLLDDGTTLWEKISDVISFGDKYNKHFHDIYISRWFEAEDLIEDNPTRIKYPRLSWPWDEIRSTLFWIFEKNAKIKLNDVEKTEEILKNVLEIMNQDKNIMVVTNHATFANIPLFIWRFIEYSKKLWIKLDEDKITTIVWPAILTHKKYKTLGLSISNFLKTIPVSSNTQSDNLKKWFEELRRRFLRIFMDSLNKEKGNMFLLAPGWTKDYINKSEDWKINKIQFIGDEDLKWSISLVDMARRKWSHILLVGMNDVWILNPQGSEFQKSNIPLSLKLFTPEQAKKLIQDKKVMKTIAENVLDEKWNAIWETTSKDKFVKMKTLNNL